MDDPRQNLPSASGIERRYLCKGSANAEANLVEPADEANDVKDSGVQIHAALSGDTEALMALSSDDLAVYEDMSRKSYESAERHGFDPARFIAEERLWFPVKGGSTGKPPEFSGQPDRVYLQDGRGLVQDYKAGFLPVTTAKDNPQLATLAVLAIANYGIAEVTVEIIPRFGAIKESATYDLQSATGALEFIRFIIAESNKPDALRTPSNKACKYCLAARHIRCPEFQAYAATALAIQPETLPALPSDKLAAAIDRIPAALKLIDDLKAEGKRRLAAGDEEFSKLYELTKGRKTREITDLPELFKRVKALHSSITDEIFTAQCSIDLGTVDKDGAGRGLKWLVHIATDLKGALLDRKTDEVLAGIVEEGRTAGSLKPKEP